MGGDDEQVIILSRFYRHIVFIIHSFCQLQLCLNTFHIILLGIVLSGVELKPGVLYVIGLIHLFSVGTETLDDKQILQKQINLP